MDTKFDKYHTLRDLRKLCEIKCKRNNHTNNTEQRSEDEGMELMSMGTDRLYIIDIDVIYCKQRLADYRRRRCNEL
jgi:hypothetical protein